MGEERRLNWLESRTIRNIYNDFSFIVIELNWLTIYVKGRLFFKLSCVLNESEDEIIEPHQCSLTAYTERKLN